jgi:hypothetical protein
LHGPILVVPKAQSAKFENISKLGAPERLMTDKGRGDAAVTKTKRLRRVGRRQRGLMGLPCFLDADGSLSRFPGRDLVREEPLVGETAVHGGRVEA